MSVRSLLIPGLEVANLTMKDLGKDDEGFSFLLLQIPEAEEAPRIAQVLHTYSYREQEDIEKRIGRERGNTNEEDSYRF